MYSRTPSVLGAGVKDNHYGHGKDDKSRHLALAAAHAKAATLGALQQDNANQEKRKDEVDGENNVFHGAFAKLTRLSRRKGGAAQGAWEAHRALRALFAMGEAVPADAVAAGLGMPPAGVFGPR